MRYSTQDLTSLKPQFDSFIGVDSDGCVFDTMAVKQCSHFHPLIIQHWGFEAVQQQLRDVAEFVNLRSKFRGRNRFPALLMTFEMLANQRGVAESGVTLPLLDDLRAYCESGLALGNETLEAEVQRTGSEALAKVLAWSLAINEDIERNMPPVKPFPSALEALKAMQASSDVIVVSQTPEAALIREWEHNDMVSLVKVIGGQELGSKTEQIKLAAAGKYNKSRVLLIGDAPGDLDAARAAGICFYPIQPGDEDASWKRFHEEIYGVFLAGRYKGLFEDAFVSRFLQALPEKMGQKVDIKP